MPDPNDTAPSRPPAGPDLTGLRVKPVQPAPETTFQTIKRNLTPELDNSQKSLGKGHEFDDDSPQSEGEQQYKEKFGSPLERAYGHAKNFLAEHEQHLSESVLKPFRQGLDNLASDLEQAASSGHTKSGGTLTPATRALVGASGAALRAVPVGSNVKETAQALIVPPEFPEGRGLSAELKATERAAPNLEGLRVRRVEPNLEGLRVRKAEQVVQKDSVAQHIVKSSPASAGITLDSAKKMLQSDSYELKEIPVDSVKRSVSLPNEVSREYAKRETPIPPIVLDPTNGVVDGNHRLTAAKIRGQETISAYVPKSEQPRLPDTRTHAATETLYHGSPDVSKTTSLKPGNAGGYFGNGIYLSRDREVAGRFSKLESSNPTLERNADGSFTDINTGKRVPGGRPGVVEATLNGTRLKSITIDEMEAEVEKFRQPNGVINLDAARNAVAEKYAKQGYDGFDVPASKNFNEPQVLIFPSSKEKLSITGPLGKTSKGPENLSILTPEGAQPLAEKLGAKVVGSVATGKTSADPYGINRGPKDLDLRIDGEYKPEEIVGKLKAEGFEPRGSSLVSPEEVKNSGKSYGKRAEHFESSTGEKIDVWHDGAEKQAPPLTPGKKAALAKSRSLNLKNTGIGLSEMDPSDARNWIGYDGKQKTLKVYRGVDAEGRTVEPGDFVTTSKESAAGYGPHVIEMDVPASELRYVRGHQNGDPSRVGQGGQVELLYAPKKQSAPKKPLHERLFDEALKNQEKQTGKTAARTTLNASGESSASQEAISRVASEKAQGTKRFRVDTRTGQEVPLYGPDAVDARANPYEVIIQRTPGKGETLLDSGARSRPYKPKR